MKNYIQVLFVLISLTAATQVAAVSNITDDAIHKATLKTLKTHETIRSASLRISLNDNLHGFVDSKMCSFCKPLRIRITPKTIAYHNNIKVPLEQAKKRLGRYVSIVYNLETKNISAIRW